MEVRTINKVAVFRGTPKLLIDAELAALRGRRGGSVELRPEQKIERRIVYALCRHLIANDFRIYGLFDGEEFVDLKDEAEPIKAAMELVFNLDESSLRFWKDGYGAHGVLLVTGNGCDIICDWNFTDGDPDGFNAVMDAFDPYEYV